MSEISVEAACGTTKDFNTRPEAEDGIDTHLALCESCGEDDIVAYTGERPDDLFTDGGPEVVKGTTPVDIDDNEETHSRDAGDYNLPDDGPSVDEDPLVWMPDEFTKVVDGTVTITRKGFEVLAHHYDIQGGTEMIVSPVDT